MKKKYRVFGHTSVTVSTVIEIDLGEETCDEDIYSTAIQSFDGIHAFCGNGGVDKIIGVCGSNETIAADDPVEFDDYSEEL